MNNEIPAPPPLPGDNTSKKEEIIDNPGILSLLRHPAATLTAARKQGSEVKLSILFLAISVSCFLVFGFVLGTFSGGGQLWSVPLKIVGGMLFASLLCLPSLVIFGAMGGMNLGARGLMFVISGFLALTGLMFVGFAPVVWLFSVSTESLGFMGFLAILIALISLFVACNAMLRMGMSVGLRGLFKLVLWQFVFILVVLQLSCTLRPILGPYDGFMHLKEKRFFIEHWIKH